MTTPDSEPKPPRKHVSRKKVPFAIKLEGIEGEHGLRLDRFETPEEIRSRLSIAENKAAHEIWRDMTILRGCLFAVPVLMVACLGVLFLPGGSAEPRTWATSSLTGIVTGVVGYSLGQHGKVA